MKLSLNLIRRELEKKFHIVNASESEEMLLENCVLYQSDMMTTKGMLILGFAEELNQDSTVMENRMLVSIGIASKTLHSKNKVIELDAAENIVSVLNYVNLIFNSWQKLDRDIIKAVYQGAEVQKIIDLLTPFFGNEMVVMNSNFRIVACSYPEIQTLELANLDQPDSGGLLPVELANFFRNDRIYRDVENEKEPFYYDPSIFPIKILCINLFVQNEFVSRMTLNEVYRPIDSCDERLMKYFSGYIQQIYDRVGMDATDAPEHSFVKTMESLLTGETVSELQLNSSMNLHRWNINDSYLCICVIPGMEEQKSQSLAYYCSKIANFFADCCVIPKQGYIAGVINLKSYNCSVMEFLSLFILFQREANFRIGYSDIFLDIREIKAYYTQAQIALNIGMLENPTIWTHGFRQHLFSYLKNKMTEELESKYLMAEEIIRLQEYDKENRTEYVKTLQKYLELDMNAVQTASALFIHRATMVYRLKRLEEIGGIDFTNKDQVLYLKMSYRFWG